MGTQYTCNKKERKNIYAKYVFHCVKTRLLANSKSITMLLPEQYSILSYDILEMMIATTRKCAVSDISSISNL